MPSSLVSCRRVATLTASLLLVPALAACGDDDAPSGASGQSGAGSSGHAGQAGGSGGVAGKGVSGGPGGASVGGAGIAGSTGGAGQGGAVTGGTGGSASGAGGSLADAGAGGASGAGSSVAGAAGVAGAGSLDDVIAAMPPGSWKELPGTDLAKVCPPGNHYPCDAVVSAWSGGALDDVHDRLVVFGGGHGDSPYNNLFTFDLHDGVWKRWTDLPAGMTGDSIPAIYQDKRVESCGLYPAVSALQIPDAWLTPTGYLDPARCDDPSIVPQLDPQQPRSTHTYGNVAFSAATGRFYNLGSVAMYPSGQARANRLLGFDFTTGLWVRGKDSPESGYGTSATDDKGLVWYVGQDGGHLTHYDPAADAWTKHGASASGFYYAGGAVDTKRRHFVLTRDGSTVTVYDLAQPDKDPAKVTTSGLATALAQAPGFEAVPSLDRLVAWSGGRTLHWLDPATWTWTSVEGTGDDPGPSAMNGTFGRFRHSPKRGVFVVVNEASKNVSLYKLPAAAP